MNFLLVDMVAMMGRSILPDAIEGFMGTEPSTALVGKEWKVVEFKTAQVAYIPYGVMAVPFTNASGEFKKNGHGCTLHFPLFRKDLYAGAVKASFEEIDKWNMTWLNLGSLNKAEWKDLTLSWTEFKKTLTLPP